MKCERCGNEDPTSFYHGSNGWYCRKCISFGRAMLEEEQLPVSLNEISQGSEEYTLQFPLTRQQRIVSRACQLTIDHNDVLLQCVCGAGKTEMVVESIAAYLKKGCKVCFAIARRQVVLEVSQRLQQYFTHAKVIAVCQGYTTITDGDLIVCTTHQLYRYYQAFDLLILDEPDAFPFRGNDVLHGIAKASCKGHTIYLTATPDEVLKEGVRKKEIICYELLVRPHGHPIPVPDIVIGPKIYLWIRLWIWLKEHEQHPRMIFVPTIAIAKRVYTLLHRFVPCLVCTSKSENRDEIITTFREQKHGIIVATTILERGVTIPEADICIYQANHHVFDEAGLVQMAGRAGRSFVSPSGDVLFLCTEKSALTYECRDTLRKANESCNVCCVEKN